MSSQAENKATVAASNIRIGGGELQPHISLSCLMKSDFFDKRVQAIDTSLMFGIRIFADSPVNDQVRSNWLSPSDWISLALVNVEMFTLISKKNFWLIFIGYKLEGEYIIGNIDDANRFSMLSLTLKILTCSQQSSSQKFHTLLCDYTLAYKDVLSPLEESKEDMKDKVVELSVSLDARYYTSPWCLTRVEESRKKMSTLVPLTICLSDEASVQYWYDKLIMRLEGTTFPTAAQAIEVQTCIRVLALTKHVSLTNILKILVKDASSLTNSPLCSCAAVTLANLKKELTAPNSELKLDVLLLTLDSILYFIAMYSDKEITVDNLKESKWTNLKSWPNASMFIRRTVVISLARLSPLALFGLFRKKGLWKHIFRSMHLEHLAMTCTQGSMKNSNNFDVELNKEKQSLLQGFENIVLLSKFLHGALYPKSVEEYNVKKYVQYVKRPLVRLMKDPLFAFSPLRQATEQEEKGANEKMMIEETGMYDIDLWLNSSDDFQIALAGKRIPCPVAQVPATMLAIGGNTRKQWIKLLESGQLTPNQVLANIRSLILLDIDPTLGFEAVLSKTKLVESDMIDDEVSMPVVDPLKALKLKLYLINELIASSQADLFMAEIEKALKLPAGTEGAATQVLGQEEIKVKIPLRQFRDKDGMITEVKDGFKNMARTFNQNSVNQYLGLLDSVFIQGVNAAVSSPVSTNEVEEKVKTPSRAVIVYTSELRNPPRGGLPPKIPDYSTGSLWRNESISLQDLHELSLEKSGLVVDASNVTLNKVLFGVTWCEAPTCSSEVDLDIAVMVYDKNWKFLFDCAYTALKDDRGLTHSGDFTSAPYPNGAREAIEVDLQCLDMKAPEAKYLALMCFSYSGQSMDTLFDASVYVADPARAGTGPGKSCVLSAARLTGKGKCNLAAFITLEENQRQTLTCVDTTLNVSNCQSTSSHTMVASCLKRLTTAAAEQEERLNIGQIAAMQAIASGMDEVVILHGGSSKKSDDQEKKGCVMSVLTRDSASSSFDNAFFEIVRKEMLSMKPCTCVNWDLLNSLQSNVDKAKKTCVFTGELIPYRLVVSSCSALWLPYSKATKKQMTANDKPSSEEQHASYIAVVNIRSDDNKSNIRMLKQAGQLYPVMCMSGVNMLKEINRWAYE